MQRATLERLVAARREGRALVRALNLASGEEKLLDPASDTSPLGQAAAQAVQDDASRRIALEDGDWFLTVYHAPWEIVVGRRGAYCSGACRRLPSRRDTGCG
jgi:hypothetical protein